MIDRVLILGGSGRVGSSVAADLVQHTPALITIAGRNSTVGAQISDRLGTNVQFQSFDLADVESLKSAIAAANLVIHCAGPFHYRDGSVLKLCIEAGVNYVDVSDHPSYTRKVMEYKSAAETAGVTAIVNTGIFPGISNSMVRQDVEQLDEPERIHLSYVVAGSGGAGVTVMRTTFLGLQRPFEVWMDGKWQEVKPYSDREIIQFPAPYGPVDVYWFDVPEAFTLPSTFPVKTVITKFGTVPRFYNFLTWSVARWWHPWLLRQTPVIEFLSYVSHFMTDVTDRLSGIGVVIRSEVTGKKAGKAARSLSTLVHPNTAISAGYGTGSVAQLLLSGQLNKPGVWAIEEALPTDLFQQTMQERGIQIQSELELSDG
ncbi:saccharopine dehydrogenase NADP-binding domain-containing protein [Kovacikia minuta CCNUW1]|uniref:saccharopine dehydrogenase family protein n=1 Tax=Kovacikia minuta TaxID=2931930 RepID=UPI001CC93769|nr:saccharopine dehydrogenase NADP-binding domain-containing protein [Kovacikia minuta]UBF25889.1 saccharopine dehydrogenase NADP-binding domain-containing protein [Kovacikia minuta CCNUW1]